MPGWGTSKIKGRSRKPVAASTRRGTTRPVSARSTKPATTRVRALKPRLKARKRKAVVPCWPLQTYLPLPHEGLHHNLREIFDRINGRHFRGKLRRYRIEWGRRRRKLPKTCMIFGTIQEEDRIIRIHPLLDASFVPGWFLEYVIYHEMLHAMVRDKVHPSGRRTVHTDEFRKRELRFRHYHKARRWERENLLRFLR